MTALSENRNTANLPGGDNCAFQSEVAVLDAEHLYVGGMLALNEDGELEMASDSAGLRVVGCCEEEIDNADDGEKSNARRGFFYYENSATAPVTAAMIGQPCYVEDDNTVAGTSTNLISAGLVHDVDSSGVWVDQRAASLAAARKMARPVVVSVTATTATVSTAQAFQGNVIISCANAAATTITLPSAAPGYRIGVHRANAGAGYDVILQAAAADTVRGSTAAGTASNTTDAISQVLWLECENAVNWKDAMPLPGDFAAWAASA